MKVVVIGLDGATFRLLKPWAKCGELPAIAKLLKDGSHGALESSLPHVTYPAWKCYSTGKYPNKLGVYHFFSIDFTNRLIKIPFSHSFNALEIWDYLGINGFRVAIVNMPTTYPPKKVNGIMISGPVIVGDNYTYPTNLKDYIEKKFNYKPDTKEIDEELRDIELGRADRSAILEKIREHIESQFSLLHKYILPNNFDFVHLTIFYIDAIQHFFWADMENNDKEFGNVILEFWKEIDNNIMKIIKRLDEDTILILMSDHGFTKLKGIFYLNNWLYKRGYIKLNRKFLILNFLNKLGLNSDNLYKSLTKLRLIDLARRVLPRNLRGVIPNRNTEISIDFASSLIDWNKTKAIMVGDGVIYINPKIPNKDAVIDKLIKELSTIISPLDGKKVCEKIYKISELYGSKSENDPDIIILPSEGYLFKNTIAGKEWNFEIGKWSAIHDLYGIFIAYGKGIKKGYKVKEVRIYDVAPTILHIFGLPVPNDMDGRVLMEIFEENSEFSNRQPVYVSPSYYASKSEKEKIEKRIKELKRMKKL